MTSPKRLAAMGGGLPPVYIEDVFSTWLYTGNGSTQTITNGIDLAGKGGMVWTKIRSTSGNHQLFDTTRGMTYADAPRLNTNNSNSQFSFTNAIRADASGFSLGTNSSLYALNTNAAAYASWTFRKQPKFFDIVTWTGTGSAIDVAHNLGSVPGCILIKDLNDSSAQTWYVYHRGTGSAGGVPLGLEIDLPDAALNPASNPPANITATAFNTGAIYNSGAGRPIASSATYVAYLFAHNAGGFGLTGTDNVISCGSYVSGGGSTVPVNLGYEPQWMLIKNISQAANWQIVDNMRGFTAQASSTVYQYALYPNLSDAENTILEVTPTATGFNCVGASGNTFIYIAIRRGPMKTPTTGTSVYNAITRVGNDATANVSGVGFTPDMLMTKRRNGTSTTPALLDRLRGAPRALRTVNTNAEVNDTTIATAFSMDGITFGFDSGVNSTFTYINHFFRRAPGFFDVVCYKGNSTSGATQAHNLRADPGMMIVKRRDAGLSNWVVFAGSGSNYLQLNSTSGFASTATYWNNTAPTSSVFTLGNSQDVNLSGATYVAYLFGNCPGVSSVGGLFSMNGTQRYVDCGFASGARFVLIKVSNDAGGWYLYDSVRGLTSGDDPYLLLNTTAAEVGATNYIEPFASGFSITNAAGNPLNITGRNYIFLAIA